jgi:hypothetical protein
MTSDFEDSINNPRRITLPQVDESTTPTLAFGDGDSGFYETLDDIIRLALNGTAILQFAPTYFGYASGQGGFMNEVPSATNPVFVPSWSSDDDTGIGSAGADILSLIAGGVEGIRITEVAGAITVTVPSTITAPGTTGNQTINKPAGRVNIAAAGTTVTVTNSCVTANSIILVVAATADATARVTSVVPAAGSFVINTVACTAETAFNFLVIS